MALDTVFPRNPYHGQLFMAPASAGQYYYDKTRMSWIFTPVLGTGSGDGGSGAIISEQPPYPATDGDLWIQTPTYYLYTFDQSANGDIGSWVGITNNGGDNTQVHVGVEPPSGANQKQTFWFDSSSGDLRILYADSGNTAGDNGLAAPASTQWVTITSNGQSIGTASYLIAKMEGDIQELQNQLNELRNAQEASDQNFTIELG